jgi:gliding motility-associated-like protein
MLIGLFYKLLKSLRFILLASILVLFSTVYSQVNVWYFGQNAGIKFNSSGVPSSLTNGNMNTPEGCACIMGSNGKIANYSNGEKLWIGGTNTIINGLEGDKQATQSALFLAKPQDNDTVYLFTLDADCGPDGLRYTVLVNHNIVPGMKNIPLQSNVTERMCIVQHCNNEDAWLIVHGWNDKKFYAYKITGEGIDTIPVVSAVGGIHSGNILNATGYMKVSQLGDKLAIAKMGSGVVELFHFDNVNGVVSSPITLSNLSTPYGVEFNAQGNRLYVSTASGSLYNYDLSMWNTLDIQSSRHLISSTNNLIGALQIGPDNKIYVAQDNSHFLGRIASPDNLGISCSYDAQSIYLDGYICEAGLPPYTKMQQNFMIVASLSCVGDTSYFNLLGDTLRIDSLLWDFGDPSTQSDFSKKVNPKYVYSVKGLYPCSLFVYHCNQVDTFEMLSKVLDVPVVNLGNDTSLCENESLQLVIKPDIGTYYEWPDGSKGTTYKVNKVGKYWIKAKSICGLATDTLEILNLWPSPKVSLPHDTTLCEGESMALDGGKDFVCVWNNQDTSRFYVVNKPGKYHLLISDTNQCKAEGLFNLTLEYPPVSKLGNDTVICYGSFLELKAGKANFYKWQDYSTNPYYTTSVAGTFSVELTNRCGSTNDSILVEMEDCNVQILVPNAFSPNADGINDFFMPKALNITNYAMYIYTRFGEQIFETHDLNKGWDGYSKSGKAQADAYFYLIRYQGPSGQDHTRKGFVNIIR